MVFVLRGVLLMIRYGITAGGGLKCEQNATDNKSMAAVSGISDGYKFTTVVLGILSMLHIFEYLVLGWQFYHFLFKQDIIDTREFYTKHSKRYWYLLVFSVILLPYLFLGLSVPSYGMHQEIKAINSRVCYWKYHYIFVLYNALDIFHYLIAYSVRFMIIFTTLSLSKYWFPDHTTQESSGTRVNSQNANSNVEEDGVLLDWIVVSSDFHEHYKAYSSIGKKAKVINELFQTWFILPWVFYFIVSSLNTSNILRPWVDDDQPPSSIPYLLYNIYRFFTLFIPYLCTKKINTYHQKYYERMRKQQLIKFEETESRLLFTSQLLLEKDEYYDFLPRVIGTNITISIGSPLVVIFLLAGIFFTIAQSLV